MTVTKNLQDIKFFSASRIDGKWFIKIGNLTKSLESAKIEMKENGEVVIKFKKSDNENKNPS